MTSFSFGRIGDDIAQIIVRVKNENIRLATGLSGDLGGSWKWDDYYQYERNDHRQMAKRSADQCQFTRAANAVLNTSGRIMGHRHFDGASI